MSARYTHYFETTSRIEQNCAVVIDLKRQLETSNNYAWKALSEIQNVSEALDSLRAGQELVDKKGIVKKTMSALEEVTEQHKNLTTKNISDLKVVSATIAQDLSSVEEMIEEIESFAFHNEFKSIGRMIMDEFSKPATELEEAKELQELMERFNNNLSNVA